jgi:hypothetical protein
MPLQRIRRHAGFCQELRRSRCRRKPFDPIAAPFGLGANGGERGGLAGAGHAFERDKTVITAKDLNDGRALIFIQVRILALDFGLTWRPSSFSRHASCERVTNPANTTRLLSSGKNTSASCLGVRVETVEVPRVDAKWFEDL